MTKPAQEKDGVKLVATNRQVPYKYHVLDKYEAGLVLMGSEVKALREGRANLRDAFAVIRGGDLWMVNCHISQYSHSSYGAPDPLRTRKLLMHKDEISKLAGKVEVKGLALVPLKIYFKRGRAKCELALVKGKKIHDKREEARRRVVDREMEQELRKYR